MTPVPPARLLLRAKDLTDARYFEPLDVPELASCSTPTRPTSSRSCWPRRRVVLAT